MYVPVSVYTEERIGVFIGKTAQKDARNEAGGGGCMEETHHDVSIEKWLQKCA